jgi:hypothetical protein
LPNIGDVEKRFSDYYGLAGEERLLLAAILAYVLRASEGDRYAMQWLEDEEYASDCNLIGIPVPAVTAVANQFFYQEQSGFRITVEPRRSGYRELVPRAKSPDGERESDDRSDG